MGGELLSGCFRSIGTRNLHLNDISFVVWIVSLICNPLLYLIHRYGSTFPALTAEDRNLHLLQDKMCQVASANLTAPYEITNTSHKPCDEVIAKISSV